MIEVRAVWDDLLSLHRELGSPLPDCLNPAATEAQLHAVEDRFGLELPEQLRSLYGIANGVDEKEWAKAARASAELVPGSGAFVSAATAWERTTELRTTADRGGVVSLDGDVDMTTLWRPEWFAAFPVGPGNVVAVDASSGALLWVWWEAVQVEAVADSVAGFVSAATAYLRALGCRWEASMGRFDVDFDRDEALGGFPQ